MEDLSACPIRPLGRNLPTPCKVYDDRVSKLRDEEAVKGPKVLILRVVDNKWQIDTMPFDQLRNASWTSVFCSEQPCCWSIRRRFRMFNDMIGSLSLMLPWWWKHNSWARRPQSERHIEYNSDPQYRCSPQAMPEDLDLSRIGRNELCPWF